MIYTENEKYHIWLSCPYIISNKKIELLLQEYGTPKAVFLAFARKETDNLQKILNKDEIESQLKYADEKFVNAFIEKLNKENICVLSKYAVNFPLKLKNLQQLAGIDILYCKGNINLLEKTSVAIVGSRKIDSYGEEVTSVFTKKLVDSGLVIISGLATGVDALAHKTTLDLGGETIAVINGGFNHIYPALHANLANEIIKTGLLVSEQPPQVNSFKHGFPIRNRIIAAISDAVFIPQMGEKSGAIHTFHYAIDYGKNAYLAPADIFRKASAGNLCLLTDFCGSIVCSPSQILSDLKIDYKKVEEKKQKDSLSEEENLILNILQDDELHFDDLLLRTKLNIKTLNSLLTTLNISGIIKANAGNYYSKIHKN